MYSNKDISYNSQ